MVGFERNLEGRVLKGGRKVGFKKEVGRLGFKRKLEGRV